MTSAPIDTASLAPPSVTGGVRLVLRGEGLALLVIATAFYATTGLSWWLYAVLFLAPDVSFLGYLGGPRVGALAYNTLHTTIGPVLLAVTGYALQAPIALGVAAIWAAHIGFDRVLGYGLKYATGFGDTHLGRIGRR